jgi:predicted DsbA family dithiol-disulfide isomerase
VRRTSRRDEFAPDFASSSKAACICKEILLNIDIISDVVCPWCYIGKRQIEAALALYAQQNPLADRPQLTWRPFQLNPQLPAEGMSRQEYVVQKFGAARAKDVYARVTAVGAEYGIAFAFERIARQPNSVAAHSLIALAGTTVQQSDGLQDRVKEAFLHAYFLDGVDLTKAENLLAIAAAAGLDRVKAEQCLADPQSRQAVEQEDRRARAIGVEGVPFFIFNGKFGVSGAQGPQALFDAMVKAETAAA